MITIRTKFVVLLALLAIVTIFGCRKSDGFKPSQLMPPLSSGLDPSAVEHKLHIKPTDWEVLEDRRPLISDNRPQFRILTLSAKGLSKFGVTGDFVATFYNERLMITRLYTNDLNTVRSSLAREAKVSFSPEGDMRIPPSTRVWIGKDSEGRSYVGWIDLALERQQDEWIEKYQQ